MWASWASSNRAQLSVMGREARGRSASAATLFSSPSPPGFKKGPVRLMAKPLHLVQCPTLIQLPQQWVREFQGSLEVTLPEMRAIVHAESLTFTGSYRMFKEELKFPSWGGSNHSVLGNWHPPSYYFCLLTVTSLFSTLIFKISCLLFLLPLKRFGEVSGEKGAICRGDERLSLILHTHQVPRAL